MDYDLTPAEKKATKEDWIKLIKYICWKCKGNPAYIPKFDPYESGLLNARLDLERIGECSVEEKIVKLCVEKEGWFFSWSLKKNQDIKEMEEFISKEENKEALERIMKTIKEVPLEYYEEHLSIDNFEYAPSYNLEEDYDKAMDKLTHREREVIRMVVYEKLNQQDIAKKIRISQPAVSKLYNSAVEKLRKMLKKYVDV